MVSLLTLSFSASFRFIHLCLLGSHLGVQLCGEMGKI